MSTFANGLPRSRAMPLITVLLLAAFGYGVYLLFAPNHFPMNFARGPVSWASPELLVGPYPVEGELLELKRMGVVEVVSLLDAGSPVEGELEAQERERVERLGLRYVNFSAPVGSLMADDQPWATATASHIRANPVALRYLHCYLGRHRIKPVLHALDLPENSTD